MIGFTNRQLFTPFTHPESGVTFHILSRKVAPVQQGFYFVNDSMSVHGHPKQASLITINSWNEWTEASYLQPDDLYGYGYLEAVKYVFKTHGSRHGNYARARG